MIIFICQILCASRRLCAELTPQALSLVDAFGLPSELLGAPIANDWVAYNETDNQGELVTKQQFESILSKGVV